jgi:hypothetical protein
MPARSRILQARTRRTWPLRKKRLGDLGAQIVSADRTTALVPGRFVKSEIEQWATPIKTSGAKVE